MRRRAVKNTLSSLAAACLLTTSCGGGTAGSPAGEGPDTAVSNTPGTGVPTGTGPQRVEPHDDLVDVRATTFDRSKVRQDGRALDLYFWSGIEECYGVDRVEVDYRRRSIVVTIFEGREPEADACIELAVRKVVRVELGEPIRGRTVVDGGSTRKD